MEDLDYLFSTAKIRTMETRLFTKQELLGLINIEKYEEAISKLTEKGWQDPDCSDYDAMEKTLSKENADFWES